MEQTRQSVKSTFGNGLIMDFAPDTAPNQSLSNALNATFVTFNGNEGLLQNDMGNARVESAYLPEGYIPVGTCEFGDIIYVVSYNPLKNKSQIGCFPSPERNLSSSEISILKQKVSASEFVSQSSSKNTGQIKSSRIKHIVYQNKLHAGDKFIISWGAKGTQNFDVVSNAGNTTQSLKNSETYWPKLVKVHVVSVEDSGKITYLDDDVKWYTQDTKINITAYTILGDTWELRTKSDKETVDRQGVQIPEKSPLIDTTFTNSINSQEAVSLNTWFYLDDKANSDFEEPSLHLFLTDSQGQKCYVYQREGNYVILYDNIQSQDSDIKVTGTPVKEESPFILSTETFDENTPVTNLDTYRHTLTSNYSVFQSRTPGKLALLFELEKITGFNCGHKIIKSKTQENTFDVYLSVSWDTDNYNINPCGVLITDFKSEGISIPSTPSKLFVLGSDKYNYKRMVSISRIYKQEEPQSTFSEFIKTSYYTKTTENGNNNTYTSDGQGHIGTSLIHVYEENSPKESENSGVYYINASSYSKGKYLNSNGEQCKCTPLPDDVVVNYYKRSVLKKLGTITLKDNTEDPQNNPSYTYTVCPCMPYGVLEELAITNTIHFNKKQTGEVSLNQWQYYVNTTSMYLSFGFDTYLHEDWNEVIDFIDMEFYDHEGLACVYHLTGQESYEAKFAEYFVLDSVSNNSKFITTYLPETEGKVLDRNTRKTFVHVNRSGVDSAIKYSEIKGEAGTSYCFLHEGKYYSITDSTVSAYLKDTTPIYTNDAGILYYGRPYVVKIKIFKGIQDQLNNVISDGYEEPIVLYRWMWTSPLFNDYYGVTADFDTLQFSPTLDYFCQFDGTSIQEKKYNYCPAIRKSDSPSNPSTEYLGAQILKVGKDEGAAPIKLKGVLQLSESYGNSILLVDDPAILETFNLKIAINNLRIVNTNSSITQVYETGNSTAILPEITPNTTTPGDIDYSRFSKTLLKLLGEPSVYDSSSVELWDTDGYKNYCDQFNLKFRASPSTTVADPFSYLDSSGITQTVAKGIKYTTTDGKSWSESGITLDFEGIRFNKITASSSKGAAVGQELRCVIESVSDLQNYGINIGSYKSLTSTSEPFMIEDYPFYFQYATYIGVSEKDGRDGFISTGIINYLEGTFPEVSTFEEKNKGDSARFWTKSDEGQALIQQAVGTSPFIACYYGQGQHSGKPNHQTTNYNRNGDEAMCKALWVRCSVEGPLKSTELTKGTPRVGGANKISDLPYSYLWEEKGTHNAILSPALQDADSGEIYLLGDWFLGQIYTDSDRAKGDSDIPEKYIKNSEDEEDITKYTKAHWMDMQQFYCKQTVGSNITNTSRFNNYGHSIAHLIASMLCSFYVIKTSQNQQYIPDNIVKLSDNTEQWKADIVVQVEPTYTTYNSLDYNTPASSYCFAIPLYCTDGQFRWYSLSSYLKCALSHAGLNNAATNYLRNPDSLKNILASGDDASQDWWLIQNKINLFNVNPLLQTVVKTTEFSYDVPYDVSSLEGVYTNASTGIPYTYISNAGNEILGTTLNSLKDNKIYIMNGSEDSLSFTEFNEKTATIYLLSPKRKSEDDDAPVLAKSEAQLYLNTSSNLFEVLYWDGNKIQAHNLSKLSQSSQTSLLHYWTTGDDPEIRDIRNTHIFNYFNCDTKLDK